MHTHDYSDDEGVYIAGIDQIDHLEVVYDPSSKCGNPECLCKDRKYVFRTVHFDGTKIQVFAGEFPKHAIQQAWLFLEYYKRDWDIIISDGVKYAYLLDMPRHQSLITLIGLTKSG